MIADFKYSQNSVYVVVFVYVKLSNKDWFMSLYLSNPNAGISNHFKANNAANILCCDNKQMKQTTKEGNTQQKTNIQPHPYISKYAPCRSEHPQPVSIAVVTLSLPITSAQKPH